jgi:tetratricopeptide (TPR) repeat protein
MKALEKDRNRRYETASGLAMDVQRYLNDEPVKACPPSVGYRVRKLVRRNKGVLTAALLIAIALVVGTVVSAWQASRATRAEALANERLQGEQHQRALAQENAADANARRREAEAARHEAIANLQQAREAVDQMLTRVSEEKLFSTPQAELLRKDLLEDALTFYQRFLRQAGADPVVRLGTAEAYRRTGQIYTQLGQPEKAERALHEAITLLEKLVTDLPSDPANRLALALAYHQLGDALERLARHPESAPALRRAIGVMQGLIADFPEDEGYPRILAPMDRDLARVLERLIQVARSLSTEAFSRENLRSEEKRLAAAPNDPQRRHAVAFAQLEYGKSLHVARPREAERLYREAIAGNRKLASEFPLTAEYRMDLADACQHLLLLLRAGRRFAEAEAVYRESLPRLEKLVAEAPTLHYARRLLVEHHWDYALMLEAAGRPREAETALQRAITSAETMWRAFPTYAWTPARLAYIHNHIGNRRESDGRVPEAEAAYRTALDISEKSVRAFPHTELRHRLADSCLYLGLLLMRSERREEATRVFQKPLEPGLISATACDYAAWRLATDTALQGCPPDLAVEFARKAVALAPEDGVVWKTLGAAQFRAGNWQEAIDALEKSKDLRQGGDGVDGFFLAMAHWQLGEREEARRWHDRSVAWMDANKPDNEELRRLRAEADALLGRTDVMPNGEEAFAHD